MRSMFVSHEGQKELIVQDGGSYETADFGKMAKEMGVLLGERVKDPSLADLVMSSFSTTINNDRIVGSVIFMSTMQEYFTYTFMFGCGLPSVTLLGSRGDWEDISNRLEKIPSFGKEPAEWYTFLKPVIKRFINTFDAPEPQETKDFWQRIVHHQGGGSSPSYVSGWLVAFGGMWDTRGNLLRHEENMKGTSDYGPKFERVDNIPPLELDGTILHYVYDLQNGYASVPVKFVDVAANLAIHSLMVAGSVGMKLMNSDESNTLGGHNTLPPVSGWFIFERKEISPDLYIMPETIIG